MGALLSNPSLAKPGGYGAVFMDAAVRQPGPTAKYRGNRELSPHGQVGSSHQKARTTIHNGAMQFVGPMVFLDSSTRRTGSTTAQCLPAPRSSLCASNTSTRKRHAIHLAYWFSASPYRCVWQLIEYADQ